MKVTFRGGPRDGDTVDVHGFNGRTPIAWTHHRLAPGGYLSSRDDTKILYWYSQLPDGALRLPSSAEQPYDHN